MTKKPRCPEVSIMESVQCMLWKGHRGPHVSGPHGKQVYRWETADKPKRGK